ncbi:hypothetical protein KKF82_06710 [Patescibacteria group bacterium]|nr:hypothetical protein [Patescibacteria group bacterium]
MALKIARAIVSESLGRIVTSHDMLGSDQVEFALAMWDRLPYSIRRLFPVGIGDVAPGPVGVAEILKGGWIVRCPFCSGMEYVAPPAASFLCCSCWNRGVGGKLLAVKFPGVDEQIAIESALLLRPDGMTRDWLHGEGVADLHRQNHEHGIREA